MYRLIYVSTMRREAMARPLAARPRRAAAFPRLLRIPRQEGTPSSRAATRHSCARAGSPVPIPSAPYPPLDLVLRLQCRDGAQSTYLVRIFDADTGLLKSHHIRDSFEASVQLVRYCLANVGDFYFAGTWKSQVGHLKVMTPNGRDLASIDPVDDESAAMERPNLVPTPALSA